ncbi:potassium channel subfamily K member 13 [Aplochiton taeniatus]
MLAGAAIFSALERPEELKAHHLWERKLMEFSHRHRVDPEDLRTLLRQYERANSAGVRADGSREQWDFPGSFYFVGTVVSTIGFGMTAPSTPEGKVLLILYGLLGCSATILFFNLFLERVITMLGLLSCWCHRRRSRNASGPQRGGHTLQRGPQSTGVRSGKECVKKKKEWKPSVYSVTLILLAATLLVACGAATLYSTMEGWSYFEALYFCFVAFSTVGFGDLVSGQRERHEDTLGYQVTNCLLMLLGVCCTYSLFNAISVVVKQALDWILSTLGRHRTACACWPHPRPLPTADCCDRSSYVCLCWRYGEEAPSRHQRQTVNQWGHNNMMMPVFLPHTLSKCQCADARVETGF